MLALVKSRRPAPPSDFFSEGLARETRNYVFSTLGMNSSPLPSSVANLKRLYSAVLYNHGIQKATITSFHYNSDSRLIILGSEVGDT